MYELKTHIIFASPLLQPLTVFCSVCQQPATTKVEAAGVLLFAQQSKSRIYMNFSATFSAEVFG